MPASSILRTLASASVSSSSVASDHVESPARLAERETEAGEDVQGRVGVEVVDHLIEHDRVEGLVLEGQLEHAAGVERDRVDGAELGLRLGEHPRVELQAGSRLASYTDEVCW